MEKMFFLQLSFPHQLNLPSLYLCLQFCLLILQYYNVFTNIALLQCIICHKYIFLEENADKCNAECTGKCSGGNCADFLFCGSDFETYDSMCKFNNAICENPELQVLQVGACS